MFFLFTFNDFDIIRTIKTQSLSVCVHVLWLCVCVRVCESIFLQWLQDRRNNWTLCLSLEHQNHNGTLLQHLLNTGPLPDGKCAVSNLQSSSLTATHVEFYRQPTLFNYYFYGKNVYLITVSTENYQLCFQHFNRPKSEFARCFCCPCHYLIPISTSRQHYHCFCSHLQQFNR